MTHPGLDPTPRFSAALAGHYVIERELGAGGMAVVYLARDVRHDRKVALKVLRPDLAAAIGVERFLNEIKTTANLQHPHIVPLHDSGEVDGVVYYVMPFIEGVGLRERLDRERQLPVADAVRIARDVASALDYAHRHGVIHRDIKPENILLHDGSAMVADFGISLAVQSAGGARLTQTGLSLGTPHYMSPEQAMGERTIDARADVYALSAVLYEMLVGEPPFTGPTVQAIVARTLSEQPRSVTAQRHAVTPALDAVVQRGLEKLPADRFATAAEFSAALESDAHAVPASRSTPSTSRWRTAAISLGAVSAALAVGVAWLSRRAPQTALPALTAYVTSSPRAPSELQDIALSPDGTTVAYASNASMDGGRIWLRKLRDTMTTPIPGTEGAHTLFWAPDGSGIGFIATGWLCTVTLRDGNVRRLAPAPLPVGGAWGPDGTIVYSPTFRHLWRVSATGGKPTRALGTDNDTANGSRDPSFLPDGHRVMYWDTFLNGSTSAWVGDLKTGKAQKFADGISSPVYVAGYLLYFQYNAQTTLEQPGVLYARKFDINSLKFTGDAFAVTGRVDRPDQSAIVTATRDFVVARETDVAQDAGGGSHGTLYWLDRATGKTSLPLKGTGATWGLRMSHDGHRVAMGGGQLWIYDPARDVAVRHSVPVSDGPWPQVWSPDDRDLAVANGPKMYVMRLDGSAPDRTLPTSTDEWVEPVDWGRDGWLYFVREPSEANLQWMLNRYHIPDGRVERVDTGTGNINEARLSPDDRWLAWESDGSGRHEIYLGPSSGGGTAIRVSRDGGGSPRWRGDGKELFFVGGDGRIMSVGVQWGASGTAPVVGEPKRVADLVIHPNPFGRDPFLDTRFEPTPDGTKFLVQTPLAVGAHRLTLVQGWRGGAP
ncbi:MAG TPA: protein kinase [Gemmatimonadaceae bacterium]